MGLLTGLFALVLFAVTVSLATAMHPLIGFIVFLGWLSALF